MTTHDVYGGGRPRLIFPLGGQAPGDARQAEFDLIPGVTLIGSGEDADLRLPGLAPRHAEIRRDAEDEYVLVDLGSPQGSRVDGCLISGPDGLALHTGDRVELGDWTMSYYREEFADHGRPFGGRGGGQMLEFLVQPRPRPRGTSPEGGREPAADDPGEYYQ
ncbi:MAG TPA: FHA domain-containing protein [Streptosporangiaceae bacterium]|nr:FHA domain-containing protein [Streptosporangiaceae bacterium]